MKAFSKQSKPHQALDEILEPLGEILINLQIRHGLSDVDVLSFLVRHGAEDEAWRRFYGAPWGQSECPKEDPPDPTRYFLVVSNYRQGWTFITEASDLERKRFQSYLEERPRRAVVWHAPGQRARSFWRR
jgi:hypothetical protein